MATFTATLASSNLSTDGFDTEGITNDVTPKAKLMRSIQVALVLGGMSYYDLPKVVYTLTNGTGQISGRSAAH